MDDTGEVRTRIGNVVRAHQLFNGRCEACGERATHQSLHQADVLMNQSGLSINLT